MLLWRREPLTFAALLNGGSSSANEQAEEDKAAGKVGIAPSEVRSHRACTGSALEPPRQRVSSFSAPFAGGVGHSAGAAVEPVVQALDGVRPAAERAAGRAGAHAHQHQPAPGAHCGGRSHARGPRAVHDGACVACFQRCPQQAPLKLHPIPPSPHTKRGSAPTLV